MVSRVIDLTAVRVYGRVLRHGVGLSCQHELSTGIATLRCGFEFAASGAFAEASQTLVAKPRASWSSVVLALVQGSPDLYRVRQPIRRKRRRYRLATGIQRDGEHNITG